LLQTGNAYEKLAGLLRQREAYYQQVADIVMPTGRQNVHALMLKLVAAIESYKKSNNVNRL